MHPNIPCVNFNYVTITQEIKVMAEILSTTNWIQEWFLPYCHTVESKSPEIFQQIQVEFLGHSPERSKTFIGNLHCANEIFWATFFWICGIDNPTELMRILQSETIHIVLQCLLTYSSNVSKLSGWQRTVRWYVLYCVQNFNTDDLDWTLFSNFVIWRQYVPQHTLTQCNDDNRLNVVHVESF